MLHATMFLRHARKVEADSAGGTHWVRIQGEFGQAPGYGRSELVLHTETREDADRIAAAIALALPIHDKG